MPPVIMATILGIDASKASVNYGALLCWEPCLLLTPPDIGITLPPKTLSLSTELHLFLSGGLQEPIRELSIMSIFNSIWMNLFLDLIGEPHVQGDSCSSVLSRTLCELLRQRTVPSQKACVTSMKNTSRRGGYFSQGDTPVMEIKNFYLKIKLRLLQIKGISTNFASRIGKCERKGVF